MAQVKSALKGPEFPVYATEGGIQHTYPMISPWKGFAPASPPSVPFSPTTERRTGTRFGV